MTVSIARLNAPSENERAAIVAPLDAFSRARGFPFLPQPLALGLYDGDELVGGLIGQLNWNWLHIQLLGVPEQLRGQSLGRAPVAQAERDAETFGCTGIWVDTFSFQAPGFYERLGYIRFGELPNYLDAETRIFFRRMLDARQVALDRSAAQIDAQGQSRAAS
ncbi:GNAT family N-acetyltransferase [Sandaracinobacteroides saxicola]|uniref:GNAT family N-acetyltransferase n=1 Tax=Sandaracinobacteroides saxicola TaxID=2759707 RepID=A0A7G5IDY1_9SPHN|nr:GNAT family N-acetyltransferase [Sandaracinobacteroides saxicola]QMW21573.1 GNAT family N-acetyltransferase [Sandaracinobacteroides saxicola]